MSTEFFNDQWRIPSNENQNKISNYSMKFDGTNDSVNVGLIKPFDNDVSNFAISYWIKADFSDLSKPFNGALIHLDFRYNGATRGIAIESSATSLIFYTAGGLGYNTTWTTPTSGLNNNEWNHIVLNFDGSIVADADKAEFWINGSKKTSTVTNPGNNYIKAITGDGFLGDGFNSYPLEGQLDQFCTFDYTLSQDQIIQLGAEGYAFNFIPNDYIDLGTTTSYDTGDLSAAIWVKITNTGATQYIFSNSGSPSIKGFDIKVRGSNEIGLQRYNPTNGAESGWFSPGFVYDAWQHLAFTYEESTGTIKTFLNGNLVATNTGTSTATLPSVKLTIGSYKGTQNYANGELSNAAIFSSKLEDSEIATLYNNGKPGDISSLNPTAWYKLDNSELFNGAEWSIDNSKYPSVYKSSLNFSGNNQYLQVPDSNDFSFGNGTTDSPFSLSAWVNPDAVEAAGIVAKYVTGGYEWLFYVEDSNFLRLLLLSNNNAGNSIALTTDVAIPINTWTHVSATYNANGEPNGIDLYINGSLQSLVTERIIGTYQAMTNTTGPVQIGTWAGSFRPINGQVSNVSIWDAELTQAQVSEIYNNGTPSNLSSHSATSNLISWWELDNTTTGLQDSKGSNNASNIGTTKYDGFVNTLAGDSIGMTSSSLVASNIDGELISNPMALSPEPVAYYQLGDQSAYNGANYLVPNNSLSDYVFNFDGTDDFINAGSASYLNGLSEFSISVWINLPTAISDRYIVSDWNYNTSPFGHFALGTRIVSGSYYGLNLFIKQPSDVGQNSAQIGTLLLENTWHNAIFSYNSGTVTCYLNGSPVTVTVNGTLPTTLTSQDGNLNIGKFGGTSGAFLPGKLSNIALWNTELTQANATEIYNNGAPGDIPSLSPTAWWKLNASEIFNNTSTEWSVDNNAYPSVYNSSLDFDGSDSVDCGNDSSLDITGALSISFWIYGETNLAHKGIVSKCPISSSIPTVAQYHIQYQTNNTLRFVLRNFDLYTGQETTGTVPTVDLNTWQHITMTWNGTNTMTVYKNGLPVCTKVKAITNVSNTSPVLLGLRVGPTGGFLNGKLSNTAIWNTELTSTQITTLYNNGTPASDISSLSPVSWWKLDNTTTGLIDNGSASNNGTNSGATEYAGFVNALAGESVGMDSSNLVVSDLQQTSGYSPYALDFDGINDFLNCGNTLGNGYSSISVSSWINFGNPNSNVREEIISKDDGSSNRTFFLVKFKNSDWAAYGTIGFAINDGTTTSNATVSQADFTPSAGDWFHVAGTWDGTNIKLYINGDLKKTTAFSASNLDTNTVNVLIGDSSASGTYFLNGKISNTAVWNTDLSSSEITEVYNQGRPSNLHNFSGTAPVSWWQLGSNSSFNPNPTGTEGTWTCLDEIGTNNAIGSANMTNDDITNGPGYSASGLGTSSIDIVGDAPYSTANGLSENMDVLDRVSGTGNVPG
jgi:hypothetical protein